MTLIQVGEKLMIKACDVEAIQFIDPQLSKIYTHHNSYEVAIPFNTLRSMIDMANYVEESKETEKEEPKQAGYDIRQQYTAV